MERFVGGDSVVFFAYGMTNAGKTHTIQGEPGAPGVLPQLVEAVLGKLGKMSEWDLQTSMMEIYQEKGLRPSRQKEGQVKHSRRQRQGGGDEAL